MSRLFFKGEYGVSPEEPTCSSCGNPNPKLYDEYTELTFCDHECFVEWFFEQEADNYARKLAYENLHEIDS